MPQRDRRGRLRVPAALPGAAAALLLAVAPLVRVATQPAGPWALA